MAKYSLKELSKEMQQKLILELCQSLSAVKNVKESAQLLSDLLSSQEIEMIAKRLYVAKLLIKGLTYDEISKKLNVGTATISRVNVWLRESGEGYRLAVKRSKNNKELKDLDLTNFYDHGGYDKMSWEGIKRRYPSFIWPQILLEGIVDSASERQKKKLKNALDIISKTEKKNILYKRLNNILKKGS